MPHLMINSKVLSGASISWMSCLKLNIMENKDHKMTYKKNECLSIILLCKMALLPLVLDKPRCMSISCGDMHPMVCLAALGVLPDANI